MQETKEFVECEGGDGKLNDARSKVMVRFSLPGHLSNDHSLSLLANCYHPPTWCFGHSSITLTRKTSAICIRKLLFTGSNRLEIALHVTVSSHKQSIKKGVCECVSLRGIH